MNFPSIIAALNRVNQMGSKAAGSPPSVILPELYSQWENKKAIADQSSEWIKGRQQFGFVLILHVQNILLISLYLKRQKRDNNMLFEERQSNAEHFAQTLRG